MLAYALSQEIVIQRGLSTEPPKAKSWVMTLCLLVGLIFTACAMVVEPPYPGQIWHKVQTPEALGWSSAQLKLAREYSESIGSTAVMIIVNGEILDEWGDTTRKVDVRSTTKPLMNALYGIAVQGAKLMSRVRWLSWGLTISCHRSPTARSRPVLSIYCKPALASTISRLLTR
jgi:hypothetical protein